MSDNIWWLTHFEQKLDLILQKLEAGNFLTSSQEPEYIQEVKTLLRQERKIEAIKLYSEKSGASLQEALSFMDRLAMQSDYERLDQKLNTILNKLEITAQTDNSSRSNVLAEDAAFYAQLKSLLIANRKIDAIKVYREKTRLGLKEAKDAVDLLEDELKRKR
jgi:ribosomal protein L7/L12